MAELTKEAPGFVNVAAHLPDLARRQPHAPAIIAPLGRDRAGRRAYVFRTYRQLDQESDRAARGLASIGLTRGMRTVLMVKPSIEFFALTFGLFKLGAVPVMVDPGMGIAKLGACLEEAEPEAFIGIPKAQAARVILGWARGSIRIKVTVGRRWFWGGHRYRELLAAAAPEPFQMAPTEVDETAAILFTSGSTGLPKGVVYSHGNFAGQVECLRETFDVRPGERDLATFPLFGLFDPALGMTTLVPDMDPTRPADADPAKLIEAIEDFGASFMFGSPALLDRLSRYTKERDIQLGSIRRIISAGAPVPPRVLERISGALVGDAQVFTPYGATESLPNCSIGSREILAETGAETPKGRGVCVGRPVKDVTVKVIAIDDGVIESWSEDRCLPAGEVGEIVVKGPRVTRGYFGREEATRLAKIGDPNGDFYHRMGDLGTFDEQGRLWFCGRKTHRVETAQGPLFTVCCEGVFNAHPKVLRTALVGLGEPGSQTPVICVELDREHRGADQAAVVAELKELGAVYPHTRGIARFLFHPGFPVDIRHNSKIFREKLRPWAAARIA